MNAEAKCNAGDACTWVIQKKQLDGWEMLY